MALTERQREYQRKYQSKPGMKEKRAELNKRWIQNNRERYNKAKAEYRFRTKLSALTHYSGGKPRCAHCGYDEDLDALCLDHIHDNGAEHRRSLGISSRNATSGTTIYERLVAHGWMEGLQVLCYNCNTIKELRRKRGGLPSSEYMSRLQKPIAWATNSETSTNYGHRHAEGS